MYLIDNLLAPARYALNGYVGFFKGEIGLLPEKWMVWLVLSRYGQRSTRFAAHRCRSCGKVMGPISFLELPAAAQQSFDPLYHMIYLDEALNVRGRFMCRTLECPEAQAKRTYMVL